MFWNVEFQPENVQIKKLFLGGLYNPNGWTDFQSDNASEFVSSRSTKVWLPLSSISEDKTTGKPGPPFGETGSPIRETEPLFGRPAITLSMDWIHQKFHFIVTFKIVFFREITIFRVLKKIKFSSLVKLLKLPMFPAAPC